MGGVALPENGGGRSGVWLVLPFGLLLEGLHVFTEWSGETNKLNKGEKTDIKFTIPHSSLRQIAHVH